MSVLVSGGAGYIGSHTIVELLEAGYDVVSFDNLMNSHEESNDRIKKITGKDFKFYKADMLDREALDRIFEENPDIDSVIHFAGLKAVGESVAKPIEYYHNNLTGTLNLCAAMKKYGVKVIVFSSSATVYGDPDTVPITEESRIGGTTNPYGTSKLFVEMILQDLCNPTPGIGWLNAERSGFLDRARCDLSFSLALIHHLCIGNNLPMDYVAQMLSRLGDHAVLEFVPKEDSQTQRLLRSREDIFPNYDLAHCLEAFSKYFSRAEQFPVKDSLRTILFFQR